MVAKSKLGWLRWIALALFAGATLSLMQLWWTPDLRTSGTASISVDEFSHAASSRLRNITVYPPAKAGDGAKLQFVTGELQERHRGEVGPWKPFRLYAPVPFAAQSRDVVNFLQLNSAPGLYRYAWWASPSVIISFWMGTCLLVIVGLIPGAIVLVTEIMRLSSAPAAESQPAPTTSAHAPIDELVASENELVESTALSDDASRSIKPLTNEHVPQPLPATSDEPKDYRGEYYPVAHPHGSPEKANKSH